METSEGTRRPAPRPPEDSSRKERGEARTATAQLHCVMGAPRALTSSMTRPQPPTLSSRDHPCGARPANIQQGGQVARPVAPRVNRVLADAEETFLGGTAAQEGAML